MDSDAHRDDLNHGGTRRSKLRAPSQITRRFSTRALARLSSSLVIAACLASCGIRIPIPSQSTGDIQRTPVRSEAPAPASVGAPHVLVWMIADKYHTGMVFPYPWLEESGFIPPAGFGRPNYVTMSWGNRDAYSEQGVDSAWKIFRVLFTPTPSVMELIPSHWDVVLTIPHQRIWRKLVLRERGPALAKFLNQCSATDAEGRPIVVCKSSWGDGVQLESRYPYFIPRVCNVWTVQTIECLGGEINPWLALTADGLAREAEKPPNDFELIWPGNEIAP